MQLIKKYYILIPILIPLLTIGINIHSVLQIDKKLEPVTVPIQYSNTYAKDGIWYNLENWKNRIHFYDTNDHRYERLYSGLSRYTIREPYRKINKAQPKQITILVNPITLKYSKTPFFNLGRGTEKGREYYFDIYSYLKTQNMTLILISVLISIGLLIYGGTFVTKKAAPFYFTLFGINLVLFFCYIFL